MIEQLGWHFPDNDSHFIKYCGQYPNTSYQQTAINEAYKFVKNFDTVIDIGANIGLHSVRFSQKFQNVFSFEPVSSNYECLEKNTINLKNITRFKVGLGETKKIETISIPKTWNNCGAYSIVDFIASEEELIKEEIQVLKLDEFNFKVDLIKIDTQGFELPILKGSIETLKRCKPVLILEIEVKDDYNEMFSFLTPLEYICVSTIKKDKIWVHKELI